MGQMQKNEPRRVCVDVPSSQSIASSGTRVKVAAGSTLANLPRPCYLYKQIICTVRTTPTFNNIIISVSQTFAHMARQLTRIYVPITSLKN